MKRAFQIQHWIWFATALLCSANPGAYAAAPLLEKTNLFAEATGGFRLYRIPGVVVTARGTVLAYCEARKLTVADRGEIEIHLRRSTDGGRTWSAATQAAHHGPRLPRNPHLPEDKQKKDMGGPDEQTVNNPVAIACRDGTMHLIYCVEYMRCFHQRSEDDGVSWSAPVEITSVFDAFRSELDWQVIATGPGHAIELRSGRLLVPFWMATYDKAAKLRKAAGVIFSDDHGRTWQRGKLAVPLGGEPNLAQLSDGRVMLTARNSDPHNRRLASFSADDGLKWSPPEFVEALPEHGCMAGLVAHPGASDGSGPVLLFSNPDTTDRAHKARRDVTIRLSRDGGRTWPFGKTLQTGPSAYSDLAVLPDGTVLCFYESGDPQQPRKGGRAWAYSFLTMARFNLEWLLAEPPTTR